MTEKGFSPSYSLLNKAVESLEFQPDTLPESQF